MRTWRAWNFSFASWSFLELTAFHSSRGVCISVHRSSSKEVSLDTSVAFPGNEIQPRHNEHTAQLKSRASTLDSKLFWGCPLQQMRQPQTHRLHSVWAYFADLCGVYPNPRRALLGSNLSMPLFFDKHLMERVQDGA